MQAVHGIATPGIAWALVKATEISTPKCIINYVAMCLAT